MEEQTVRPSGVALCLQCHRVIRFQWSGGSWRIDPGQYCPDAIEIVRNEVSNVGGDGYRDAELQSGSFEAVHRPKKGFELYFLILFSLLWNGALVAVCVFVFAAGISLLALLISLAHGAIGLGLFLFVSDQWFNRTRLSIGNGNFCSSYGPIPIPSRFSVTLPLGEIRAFEATQAPHRFRPKGGKPKWDVRVLQGDGDELVALAGVTEEEARYMADRLAEHLR